MKKFADIFPPDRNLRALDIGTDRGDFIEDLAQLYPLSFRYLLGIDLAKGNPSVIKRGRVCIEKSYEVDAHNFVASRAGKFDLIFMNAPSGDVFPSILDTIGNIMGPDSLVIFTTYYHMLYNASYNAFETELDVVRFYEEWRENMEGRGFNFSVISNQEGYPKNGYYALVPGIGVLRN